MGARDPCRAATTVHWATKAAESTDLCRTSSCKGETSLTSTGPEADPSTAAPWQMSPLYTDTSVQGTWQWPTCCSPTLPPPSSTSPSTLSDGWTDSTSSSERSSTDWT